MLGKLRDGYSPPFKFCFGFKSLSNRLKIKQIGEVENQVTTDKMLDAIGNISVAHSSLCSIVDCFKFFSIRAFC